MENPITAAVLESLPENVTPESLPAKADVTQDAPAEAPAQQAGSKEPPFNEHPRWKEVQEQRRLAAEEAARAKAEAAYWKGLAEGTQKAIPKADPDAGMTPEEKAFWARSRQIAREAAEEVIGKARPEFENQINLTRQHVAEIARQRFLEKYPEVKSGSVEETQIANLYSRGYSLDDARNLVFREADIKKAQEEARTTQTTKTKEKMAANLEQRSLPPVNGIPAAKKLSFREQMAKNIDEARAKGELAY